MGDAEVLVRIDHVDYVVRHSIDLVRGWLAGPDIQVAVYLAAISPHDLPREAFGESHGQCGLAGARRPHDDDYWDELRHRRQAPPISSSCIAQEPRAPEDRSSPGPGPGRAASPSSQ